MMGIGLAITWAILAVYIVGTLPTTKARLALEREEAAHPEPPPEIVETDLSELHRTASHQTAHSVHSRKSKISRLAEETEAVLGVSM
jgi:hypothetical protein